MAQPLFSHPPHTRPGLDNKNPLKQQKSQLSTPLRNWLSPARTLPVVPGGIAGKTIFFQTLLEDY